MSYNNGYEVIFVENQEQNLNEQEELTDVQEEIIPKKQGYTPRPKHQVWLARIGLVAFLIALVVYYLVYFRGGR